MRILVTSPETDNITRYLRVDFRAQAGNSVGHPKYRTIVRHDGTRFGLQYR